MQSRVSRAPLTQPGLRWLRSPEPVHLPGSPSPHLRTAKGAAGARLAAVPESAGRYSSRRRRPGPALLPPSPRPARHPCCCHRAAGSREARATRRCSRARTSPEKGNGAGAPPSGSRPAKSEALPPCALRFLSPGRRDAPRACNFFLDQDGDCRAMSPGP